MNTETAWGVLDRALESIRGCWLFEGLDTRQMLEVAALVDEQSLEPEELLLREGDEALHFFVVIDGRGVAQLEMNRGWLSLGLVGPSDSAGWSSLVEGQVYPASVKALTPMRVARIEASSLVRMMDLDPSIGYPIYKGMSSVFCRQYQSALDAFKTNR